MQNVRDWQWSQPAPQALGLVPMVVEQSGRGERAYDIYSRLLKERIVCAAADSALSRHTTDRVFIILLLAASMRVYDDDN